MENNGVIAGEKVMALRKQKKLTQEELAQASGISRATICAIENDKSKRVSTGTLAAIAVAMDVPVTYFFH